MHRLSKISASLASKNGDKLDKKISRPSVLHLLTKDDGNDDVNKSGTNVTTVTPFIADVSGNNQEDFNAGDTLAETNNVCDGIGVDQIKLDLNNAADIEALEQSLTTLLDDFRSGKMNALDEKKLKMMRKARQEMEDLTAFHIKLHKMQAPNFCAFNDDSGMDEQYDVLFRKLDKLHCFLCAMSFDESNAKKDNISELYFKGKEAEMVDEES